MESKSYLSNQFPISHRVKPDAGVLWYYPTPNHAGQKLLTGTWAQLEQERKRLSCMGYKYNQFKKRYK